MRVKSVFISFITLFAFLAFIPSYSLAQELEEHTEESHSTQADTSHGEEAEFDPGTYILEHIADSHEWHLWTNKEGHHVSIPLPVIIYSKTKGLNVFSSKHLAHGHSYLGYKIIEEGDDKGRIADIDENDHIIEGSFPLDLSITKNVTAMLISALLILWLFITLARSYKRSGVSQPKGIQGFLEPVVIFVRDEIAVPNIGEARYRKFVPYLLTAFFFILINNLLGLVPFFPGGANVTGNIAVTFTLAAFTMVITNVNGNKAYWKHIFNTPGVPWWLKYPIPLMPLVELIGVIAKPFALMIRLFANITAGHIIVLSLVSLIFIFKSLTVAPVSILFVLFMDCLELLVAFLQAYVFTLLSALFIGLAVQEEHH